MKRAVTSSLVPETGYCFLYRYEADRLEKDGDETRIVRPRDEQWTVPKVGGDETE